MNDLNFFSSKLSLFNDDYEEKKEEIFEKAKPSKILVIGGAGSVGRSVVKQLFELRPACLHVIDVNENSLVELVRDVRSSLGYKTPDFRTFLLDFACAEFDLFMDGMAPYDYVFNLAAVKHVRSERDKFSLYRILKVNVLASWNLLKAAEKHNVSNLFAVSTDKAAEPVNLMGASKRVMERLMMEQELTIRTNASRFANVAFSDGSLLDGFKNRYDKQQPLSAPSDIKRYFISSSDAGRLCIISALASNNRETLFPNPRSPMRAIPLKDIAFHFLEGRGYEPYICHTEEEARKISSTIIPRGKWPLYLFETNTSGEKEVEQFIAADEVPNLDSFRDIGVLKHPLSLDSETAQEFLRACTKIADGRQFEKSDFVELFKIMLPTFSHLDNGQNLDSRM